MKPQLFLIPTPLGHGDMRQILAAGEIPQLIELKHFIVETPKIARQHLKSLGLTTPLQELSISTLSEHTKDNELAALLTPLEAGHSVGLISDAGAPAIADPGANLVRLAHQKGICVRPLIGPSSILLALMASGTQGQRFMFHGYLPQENSQRKQSLKELLRRSKEEDAAQIFIETPYRNPQMLASILETLPAHTRLSITCDATLPTEETVSDTLKNWRADRLNLKKRPAIFIIYHQ